MKNEKGFMGRTHALSALALFLLIHATIPLNILQLVYRPENILLFITSCILVVGYGMSPDFDNTSSTAISTFGVVGKGISMFLRSTSLFIYSITKSKYDNEEADAHRGFWHTLGSSLLIGLVIFLTFAIPTPITIPILEKQTTIGFLFLLVWTYGGLKLGLAGLIGKTLKKYKQKSLIWNILIETIILSYTFIFLFVSSESNNFTWLSVSASLGHSIHILGDCCTVSGAPILAPFIPIKGKRWYNISFFKFKAGGEIEQYIFTPIFMITIIFSILKLTKLI